MVGIAHDGVGVRDVEIVTDQDDAERRMEMVEKDRSRRRLPTGLIVAQERDAIARSGVAARCHPLFDEPHDEVFRPCDRLRRGRFRFNDQHVAVG